MSTMLQRLTIASDHLRIVCSTMCVILLLLMTIAVRVSAEQTKADVKGSRDHPMISRIEGSTISAFDLKEFDEYRLPTARVPGSREDLSNCPNIEDALNDKNSIRLDRRVWKLMYDLPENRSTLEIVRSFEAALTKAGFKTIYQCAGRACSGPEGRREDGLTGLMMSRLRFYSAGGVETQRYLAARLARAEGDIYVSLLGLELDRPIARLDVIEVKPMKADLVTVSAATMAKEIATTGKVALYGIYFDTNMTEVSGVQANADGNSIAAEKRIMNSA